MSDAPNIDEHGYPQPDEHGIIRQPNLPYDLATADAMDVDAYIAEAKQLDAQGFYDIETYRQRSAASRPAS